MREPSVSFHDHWDRVYDSSDVDKLGWWEAVPEKSLHLIRRCGLGKDDLILDIGTGASTLIDRLLDDGHRNIIASDISEKALQALKHRLGPERASRVTWIVDDVTRPQHLCHLRDVCLWHDRAVLHFLTEEPHRQAYLNTLRAVLKVEGFAVIAAFHLTGADKCSGLPVRKYDETLLAEFLGEDFLLEDHFQYTYHTPLGSPRPYIYTRFRRLR
ncbi:MAG: methyltransferase domain-containing protein [candidate division KSB1 bacterium]|nr:methyltransferase domain-containing protein [candidate division KSB1 bacterium]MDQ7065186.1 methyltransferase domain-containing protein [candidate division KSB1 bacterium]